MSDSNEILSLKAILLTALSKVEAMEKKMSGKPSKRVNERQAIFDRETIRQRKIQARRQIKRMQS